MRVSGASDGHVSRRAGARRRARRRRRFAAPVPAPAHRVADARGAATLWRRDAAVAGLGAERREEEAAEAGLGARHPLPGRAPGSDGGRRRRGGHGGAGRGRRPRGGRRGPGARSRGRAHLVRGDWPTSSASASCCARREPLAREDMRRGEGDGGDPGRVRAGGEAGCRRRPGRRRDDLPHGDHARGHVGRRL